MKRRVIELLALVALISTVAVPAMAEPPDNAGSPTCSGLVIGDHDPLRVHGDHVIRDYVRAGDPGARGGPAHFGLELGPGASFCLDQARSGPAAGRP